MQEIHITSKEEGQRLYKILEKYLSQAPSSFLYKMLRKKNIKLNGKKADGKEKVQENDVITLFLSDETIEKFQKKEEMLTPSTQSLADLNRNIIFEDEDIILFNKPAGILSQKAAKEDISLNEQMISYCLERGYVTKEELKIRKPSVANRLDRNTTGLIAAGISIKGLTFLSELFRNRNLEKYYFTIVKGEMKQGMSLKGYLSKDCAINQVKVHKTKEKDTDVYIETGYEPIKRNQGYTLVKVKLVTGKPHQIRAHLAYAGYPILGDEKYGNHKENLYWKKEMGLRYQLLHSGILIFPKLSGQWEKYSGKRFEAPKPEQFLMIEQKIFGKDG